MNQPVFGLLCCIGADGYLHVLKLRIIIFFIYFCLAVLGLYCCTWAFSRSSEQGLLSSCSAQASPCGDFSCGAQALGTRASVVVTQDLLTPRHVDSSQ